MAKVLVLNAHVTPNEISRSLAMGELFIEKYKKLNPKDEIITMDLNKEEMAKITLSQETIGTFWSQETSKKYINQLKAVDKLLIVTPMINWGVSPLLKNYIDHVSLANETFSYEKSTSAQGFPAGLLTNLTVQLIATKGSPVEWYSDIMNIGNYINGIFTVFESKTKPALVFGAMDMGAYTGKTTKEVALTFENELEKAAKNF